MLDIPKLKVIDMKCNDIEHRLGAALSLAFAPLVLSIVIAAFYCASVFVITGAQPAGMLPLIYLRIVMGLSMIGFVIGLFYGDRVFCYRIILW